MQIVQTNSFSKVYKKLHSNQLKAVNEAIEKICQNPEIGEQKKGDLAWLRVYKFKVQGQLMLLGYSINHHKLILTLSASAPTKTSTAN